MTALEQTKEPESCSLDTGLVSDIGLGAKGKLVCDLQRGLVVSGFLNSSQVDGQYGNMTDRAAENFQSWQEYDQPDFAELSDNTKRFLILLGGGDLNFEAGIAKEGLSSLQVPNGSRKFGLVELSQIRKFLSPKEVISLSDTVDLAFAKKVAEFQKTISSHAPNLRTDGILDFNTSKIINDIITFRSGVQQTGLISTDFNSLNYESEVRTEAEGLMRLGFDSDSFRYLDGKILTKDPETKAALLVNRYYMISSSNGYLCKNELGCTSLEGAKIAAVAALNHFAKSYIEQAGPNERVILTGFSETMGHPGDDHGRGIGRDIHMTTGMLKYLAENERFSYLPYTAEEKRKRPQFVARFYDKALNLELRWESSTTPANLLTALSLEKILLGVREGRVSKLEVLSDTSLKYSEGGEKKIWNLPQTVDLNTNKNVWSKPGHLHSAITKKVKLTDIAAYSRIK